MKNTPIPAEIVDKKVAESGISSVGKASIREVKRLINEIEQASGFFIVLSECITTIKTSTAMSKTKIPWKIPLKILIMNNHIGRSLYTELVGSI